MSALLFRCSFFCFFVCRLRRSLVCLSAFRSVSRFHHFHSSSFSRLTQAPASSPQQPGHRNLILHSHTHIYIFGSTRFFSIFLRLLCCSSFSSSFPSSSHPFFDCYRHLHPLTFTQTCSDILFCFLLLTHTHKGGARGRDSPTPHSLAGTEMSGGKEKSGEKEEEKGRRKTDIKT